MLIRRERNRNESREKMHVLLDGHSQLRVQIHRSLPVPA